MECHKDNTNKNATIWYEILRFLKMDFLELAQVWKLIMQLNSNSQLYKMITARIRLFKKIL